MLVSIDVGVIRYHFVILADISIVVIGCIQIFVGCRLISISISIIVDSIWLLLYWLCSIRCIFLIISLLLYHNKWINFILHSDAIVPKSPNTLIPVDTIPSEITPILTIHTIHTILIQIYIILIPIHCTCWHILIFIDLLVF